MCELSATAELTNPAPQEIEVDATQALISQGLLETEEAATQALTNPEPLVIVASEGQPGKPASPATPVLINQAGWETGGKQFEVGPQNTMEQV